MWARRAWWWNDSCGILTEAFHDRTTPARDVLILTSSNTDSLLRDSSGDSPTIWIDADACPTPVKELVYRTAERRKIKTVVVANQSIVIPRSEWIRRKTVSYGADKADQAIVDLMSAGDIVIADDIPLAARAIEKGGLVIGSRGDLFDEKNIHHRLATRDLMEQLRSSGMPTEGPKPFTQKDAQAFANQLDRTLTKLVKKRGDTDKPTSSGS